MGFNISELYEQVGTTFYLCVNLAIYIVYIVILFPSHVYSDVVKVLFDQFFYHGRMQSGNISIVFVSLIICAFLLNHFSNWVESMLFPKMFVNPNRFGYLIAFKFWNIASLYNQGSQKDVLSDTVNNSIERIFSTENSQSTEARSLGVGQHKWRYYKNFAGTFKAGAYTSAVLVVYRIFVHPSFYFIFYYCAIVVASLLLWFAMDIFISGIVWNMLNLYWGQQVVGDAKKGSYLDRIFSSKYVERWEVTFRGINAKQRWNDIVSGWIIRWK